MPTDRPDIDYERHDQPPRYAEFGAGLLFFLVFSLILVGLVACSLIRLKNFD